MGFSPTIMMTTSIENQYQSLVNRLIQEKNNDGFWTGQLSSSALATAVAIVAFKVQGKAESGKRIGAGLTWLLGNVNFDGGFGDTPESASNVSTSLLCYAAISYCQTEAIPGKAVLTGIEQYLLTQQIDFNSGNITASILKYYGKDYTFSVPILSMLVICGVLDDTAIDGIPQLPFEFTLFPASWYGLFNMQVVSYAIPALVAVGIFVHKKRKYRFSLAKVIRDKSIAPALRKLSAMVPESGGFLEAIPLTAFVSMCLMVSKSDCKKVTDTGMTFLQKQQRPDGSWPIDTDLSTWVTTLSIKALAADLPKFLPAGDVQKLETHLLNIQYKEKHSFNQALPGGWGWTNFSGSVPDVDDTSGAILSLLELYEGTDHETAAIINGCAWLTRLQNNDGGFPTFCRGWNRLPFDSSCADLTGHALLVLTKTIEKLGERVTESQKASFFKSIRRAVAYLKKEQHESGFWVPLWFGNQNTTDKKNPVYGTAKVGTYINDCLKCRCLAGNLIADLGRMSELAQAYLVRIQNADGSWGGALGIEGSVEETSLAICALSDSNREVCANGFLWLENKIENHGLRSSPIGLYFATLWYDEKMYPLIFYIEALRRYLAFEPNKI
jgi:prenyltransferase beta subunit